MYTRTCFISLAIMMAVTAGYVSSAVIHVDAAATGDNSGTSWENACVDLQLALDRALSHDEIRVAGGIYRPAGPGGNRAASFTIDAAVTVLGGYAGCGAADPDARDIEQYRTVLSGDLNGDDAVVDAVDLLTESTRSENAYHVVRTAYGGPMAVDGFTITGGQADGPEQVNQCGGGVHSDQGRIVLQNCTVQANAAALTGGGCSRVSEARNCLIRNNYAQYGGGLRFVGKVVGCVVEANVASCGGGLYGCQNCQDSAIRNNQADEGGGGAWIENGAVFQRCQFIGNDAGQDGGAVHIAVGCTCHTRLWMYQCTLQDNTAGRAGGGLYQIGNTRVEMWNCLVKGNSTGGRGGGICCDLENQSDSGSCLIVNCTIFGNTANETGGVHVVPAGKDSWSVGNCIIWGNTGAAGAGTLAAQVRPTADDETGGFGFCCIEGWPGTGLGRCISVNPRFVDASGSGADLHLTQDSPCIDAGDNGFYPDLVAGEEERPEIMVDLDNADRFQGRCVDIGAYEFASLATYEVWYVQADANALEADGKSWQTALPYLQDALMLAQAGNEIRLAHGTYKPDQFALSDRPNRDREETFALETGVTIKGGYAGLGEPDPDARDIRRYETILSGDLAGTLPTLTPDNYQAALAQGTDGYYRCFHVVSAVGVDDTAVLDGVTITGGAASGPDNSPARYYHGGGVYVEDAAPVFIDCTITGNVACTRQYHNAGGAGIYCKTGSPKLVRCRFIFNWGRGNVPGLWAAGAGMMTEDSSLALVDCVFQNNGTDQRGGAMVSVDSVVSLTDCDFLDNQAGWHGGAILFFGFGQNVLTARNCLFAGNRAGERGSALSLEDANATLENCTFAENRLPDDQPGGAVHCGYDETRLKAVNCIFRDGGSEFVSYASKTLDVTFCNVEGAFAGAGNIDVDPLFARPGEWVALGTPSVVSDKWLTGDYHLMSRAGRWDAERSEWVRDNMTSPCIDAGDAQSSIMYEPFPNGGVVNMGAYGGTAEASKTYFEGAFCRFVTVGDLNGDCAVNLADLALMAGHWMEDTRIGQAVN